jgi:hypothetical protein
VDVGAQDIEMPKLEGGEGFIDQVIKPRRLNALAFNRLRYPRRIQLLNLGLKDALFMANSAMLPIVSGGKNEKDAAQWYRAASLHSIKA